MNKKQKHPRPGLREGGKIVLLASAALLGGCSARAAEGPVAIETVEERATAFAVRGWGSVYLLPAPGPLEIVVEKQDLNRFAGRDVLIARLLAPDREEIDLLRFEDDGNAGAGGGAGPIQRGTLRTIVTTPGLYQVDLEARTGHEPGHDIAWGIKTNATRYAIGAPLSFAAPELAGEIFFYPIARPFKMNVRGIGSRQNLLLRDERNELIHRFHTADSAVLERTIPPPDQPGAVWRLSLEEQRASIAIEGVTSSADENERQYPHFGYWSLHRESLFPVERWRWLITPRRVAVHQPSLGETVRFTVRNGSPQTTAIRLSLEAPTGIEARLLSPPLLLLAPEEEATAVVELGSSVLASGQEKSIRLHVTGEGADPVTGYATVLLRSSPAPADQPLSLPLVLEPYRHENLLFGFRPEFTANAPYFDLRNRPHIRSRTSHRHHSPGLDILDEDGWRFSDYMEAVKAAVPDFDHAWFASYRLANKVAFDPEGDAYTLISVTRRGRPSRDREALLLHHSALHQEWRAYRLGSGDATFEMEQFTGHNTESGPPPLLLYTRIADHPGAWAWFNELRLILPQKNADETLSVNRSFVLSHAALNPAAHSGGGSPLATRGDTTFIVWGEAVEPESDLPGVPSFIVAYDRSTGMVTDKQFLAHAPPINDSHNSPAIVLDPDGFLHVVVGAHGRPFQYLRSHAPLRIDGGWTDPVPVLRTGRLEVGKDIPERGAQTYVGLVCDPDGALHLVSRQWREGIDAFHDGHLYAALSYQRKKPGGEWEQPRVLVVPPLPDYSVYYHKLTIDREGRLYLAYNYYSVHDHYRNDLPGRLNHQAVLTSTDGGDTWKLATTEDFRAGFYDFVEDETASP